MLGTTYQNHCANPQQLRLTGLTAHARNPANSRVLCDGNSCDREQVLVTPVAGTPVAGTTVDSRYEFSLVAQAPREIPTLLDPPVGVRQNWLDTVLAKHDFVLLLFYRGLW